MKIKRSIKLADTVFLLNLLALGGYVHYSHVSPVDTEAMLDASVSIRTISNVSIDSYGDSVWSPSAGSGFLVSSVTCEVWTNHHVIANAAVIEVFPRNWKRAHGIPARLVNSTPHSDIAILQMDSCEGIAVARLGNSSTTNVGDETYVVGNPFGRNPDSVSRGIISSTSRYLDGPNAYLQTDAAVNPGNSGGALFNREGTVIGLASSIAKTSSGNNVGIGYALPINSVYEQIAVLRKGPASWGDAGINDLIAGLTPEEAVIFHVPEGFSAVNIMRTPESGPGAGKLMARDVIYKIGDEAVKGPAQVKRYISSMKPDEIVDFSLIRGGERQVVGIQLADGGSEIQKTASKTQEYTGLLGMKIEMWGDKEGEKGQFKHPVITQVYDMGPAHLSFVSSSQSVLGKRGGIVYTVPVRVTSVTGVVIEGEYQAVTDIETLDQFATKAYEEDSPILLEIESWNRDPSNFYSPLEFHTTAFYKINPTPSDSQVKTEKTARNKFQKNPLGQLAMHRY